MAIARTVPVLRKACVVDRVRCSHCRNPIKPHHATSGPPSGEHTYHQDCWAAAEAVAATDKAEQQLEQQLEQQQEYLRRIATDGLAALLSPYVSVFPQQRENAKRAGQAVAV